MTIDVSKNDISVKISGEEAPVVVRGSIVKCLRKLPLELFFRAGRDCVVNLLHVARVDAASRNISFKMRDGRGITVSRKQSLVFRRQFSL